MVGKSTVAVSLFIVAFAREAAASNYTLRTTYEGPNFFDSWNYYESDPALGCCSYGGSFSASKSAAMSNNLTWTSPQNVSYASADSNSTLHYSQLRESVHLISKDPLPDGSLVLFNLTHIPYGNVVTARLGSSVNPGSGADDGPFGLVFNASTNFVNQVSTPNTKGCEGHQGSPQFADDTAASYEGGIWAIESTKKLTAFWFFAPNETGSIFNGSVPNVAQWKEPFTRVSCNKNATDSPVYLDLNIGLCQRENKNETKACYSDLISPNSTRDAYFAFSSIQIYETNPNFWSPNGIVSSSWMTARADATWITSLSVLLIGLIYVLA